MGDGRKNNGGARKGAGRKPKADEERLRDLISPHIPNAIETVVHIMKTGEKDSDRISASKLLIEYLYGKPKQQTDVTTNGESVNRQINLTKEEIKKISKELEDDV